MDILLVDFSVLFRRSTAKKLRPAKPINSEWVSYWNRKFQGTEFFEIPRYVPYDPHPLKLKKKTDKSLALFTEIQKKIINVDELTPQELKTLEQVKLLKSKANNNWD